MSGESLARDYLDQTRDVVADKRGRVILPYTVRRKQLLLDNARAGEEFALRGDFVFLDRNSTGVISVALGSQQGDPMPMGAFDVVEGLPIDRLFVTHAAQAGLIANIWYGYHARFRANSSSIFAQGTLGTLAQQSLGGVNALVTTERGIDYGVSFSSNTALAANTNEQILAPAGNTNGVIVWGYTLGTSNAGGGSSQACLLAKNAAPASTIDGDLLLQCIARGQSAVGLISQNIALPRPVKVAAGKGLYFRNGAFAETEPLRSILYTVL